MRFFSPLLPILFLGSSLLAQEGGSVRAAGLKVRGSPEPGRPYLDARAFPNLTFKEALDLVPLPGMNRWLAVERGGSIWSFPMTEDTAEKELFADIKALHPDTGNVYAVQFHPRFAENHHVFITYTKEGTVEDGSTLSRFTVLTDGGPARIDPASELKILHWRCGGHNGAAIQFGSDGMLYLSTGDSEVPSPPDPLNTGQDLDDLLSCILRIDVDHPDPGRAYSVPKDNPFVSTTGARPEIWAYGFRNPWKMAFDRKTGRLWVGDVGWELWEMVHLVNRGGNYGWAAMEAGQPIKPETRGPTPISPPVVAHSHSEAASITGGFVYRGRQFPELTDAYIYGDYETGKIWALRHDGTRITRHEEICDTPYKIVTFGEAEDGELIFSHYAGESTLHRLVRNPMAGKPSDFPRRLSDTGLFANTAEQEPAEGVLRYDIQAPMWSDGAMAERFIALPADAPAAVTAKNGKTTWPKDAVLARTLRVKMEYASFDLPKKVETQLLHFDGAAWQGYSYRWNDEGTDADLVDADGDVMKLLLKHPSAPGGAKRYEHRFHSRGECMRCHTMWTGFINGFQPQQLKEPERFVEAGIISSDYLKTSDARLMDPHEPFGSLEPRARSWLHANCAHCHRQHGGGSVALMLNAELPLSETKTINQPPQRGTFGVEDARIIAAGSPAHSVLLHRLAVSGSGHMPILGAREVDVEGLKLLSEWIGTLSQGDTTPAFPQSLASSADAAVKQWMAFVVGDQLDLDEAFHVLLSDSPANAMRLLNYIDAGEAADSVVKATLARTATSPSGHIRALYERFLPPDKRQELLGAAVDAKSLLAHPADARRGAALFQEGGKAAACLACHFVNGIGRDFGPDLTKVGGRLDRAQILESLLHPSAILAEGFATAVVTMKDGGAQTGFIVKQTDASLTLKIPAGQSVELKKADIAAQQALPASLMPEGLLQAFTAQEAADLIAFLASLK